MKKNTFLGVLVVCILSIASCSNAETETKEKEVITKKIMYDVPIVNPELVSEEDLERDWFWGNIPESDLDKLLTKIYDNVKSGKTQSYAYDAISDYEDFEPIPKEEIGRYFEEEWFVWEYVELNESETNETVTIPIEIPLEKSQIKQLRFLEEWYYEGDEFCKRVIAVAPIFVYTDSNGYDGINILYWVDIKDVE